MSFHEDSFHQPPKANSPKDVLEWLVLIRDMILQGSKHMTTPKQIAEEIDLLIFYLEESKGKFKLIYPKRTITV